MTDERRKMATTKELHEYLDIPEQTLRDWRMKGYGPKFIRMGKHVRYRWSDVERWENANVQQATA